MTLDFSKPMTAYEFLAIILAAVAIIIPIVQMIWKKWILQTKLNFYPTGRSLLFFNQSGSYIRIDGVYEAVHKSISVKKIGIRVIRQKDEVKLNLSWSSFISPINQNMIGTYVKTTEAAHPFRIESDSIMCTFTEFGDPFDAYGKNFKLNTDVLFNEIPKIKKEYPDYNQASAIYIQKKEYSDARNFLEKDLFWEIGKYTVEIDVEYNNTNKKFIYEISVGENDFKGLSSNLDEALLSPLKSAYGIQWNYYTAIVELGNKKDAS